MMNKTIIHLAVALAATLTVNAAVAFSRHKDAEKRMRRDRSRRSDGTGKAGHNF